MYSKGFLVEGFYGWLSLQNYDATSLVNDPKRLERFLDYMHSNQARTLEEMTSKKVSGFFTALSKTKSKRTGEMLSLATQRNYLTTINRFVRYLHQTGLGHIEVNVKFKGKSTKQITVLSRSEIERLYKATTDDMMGIRDRAILSVFYGCGIRRNEGEHLLLTDVLPDKNLLYVRKGKGGKQRYVPMIGKVKKDLLNYIQTARPMLLQKEIHDHLFVGLKGKGMKGQGLYDRVKKLRVKAEINKSFGLHSLRHSIATHLLSSGMTLAQIAKFLGHSSLESTQIYTHIDRRSLGEGGRL